MSGPHPDAFKLLLYVSEDGTEEELIWNSRDGIAPLYVPSQQTDESLARVDRPGDIGVRNHVPQVGERIIVTLTEQRARVLAAQHLEKMWEYESSREYYQHQYASREEALAAIGTGMLRDCSGNAPDVITVTAGYIEELLEVRKRGADPEIAVGVQRDERQGFNVIDEEFASAQYVSVIARFAGPVLSRADFTPLGVVLPDSDPVIGGYRWKSPPDERVRREHRDLVGTPWSDPPPRVPDDWTPIGVALPDLATATGEDLDRLAAARREFGETDEHFRARIVDEKGPLDRVTFEGIMDAMDALRREHEPKLPEFVDRQGKPITIDDWLKFKRDRDYIRVAYTDISERVHVCTSWLGTPDTAVFETIVIDDDSDRDEIVRYVTESAARAGHEDACEVKRKKLGLRGN